MKTLITSFSSTYYDNILFLHVIQFLIRKESDIEDVLDISAASVVSSMLYFLTPPGEEWSVGFLKELLELRKKSLELDWEDNIILSNDDIEDLSRLVATS